MKKLINLGLLFVIFSINSFSFGFKPLNFDKRIDSNNSYQEFFIRNDSNKLLKYQIIPYSTEKENDISKYVKVYPRVLNVNPMSTGSFKVFVEDRKKITDGEKSFMLEVKSLKVPNLNQLKQHETNSSVDFKVSLNLEMYAYKGDVGEEFTLEEQSFYKAEDGKKHWKALIKNDTGRGYEIGVAFLDRANSIFGLENLGRLFNHSTAKVDIEIPKEAKYLVFWDNNNQNMVGQRLEIK